MEQKPLLEQIASTNNLRRSWNKLNKGRKESRGLSTETIQDFENSLESNIQEISKQLNQRSYRFNNVRGVLIPKKEPGKFRELRISDVRDRLVLKALSLKLDEILSPIYNLDNDFSFAYRQNRNIESAIKKMVEYYKQGYIYILEADIIDFFGTVDRALLLRKVLPLLPDNTLNDLIIQGLNQEVGNIDDLRRNGARFEVALSGIPQGNSLSPLLANIYLSDFDKRMGVEGFKMVRYADDFIVLCKTIEDAHRALSIAKEELENNLGLKIHDLALAHDEKAKTRIINPVYDPFSFLSIRFDGKQLWVNYKKVKQLKETLLEVNRIDKSTQLLVLLKRTKNVLEGWLSAFKFVDVDRDIKEIDDYVDVLLLDSLRKLDFPIKTSHLRKIKINGKERECLTENQRNNSGVSSCTNFLSSIDRNQVTL